MVGRGAIAGKPPGQRKAARVEKAKPKLDKLGAWLDERLKLIPGKSDLAKAIRYARSRWQALTCYCCDGRLNPGSRLAKRSGLRKAKVAAAGSLPSSCIGCGSMAVSSNGLRRRMHPCLHNG